MENYAAVKKSQDSLYLLIRTYLQNRWTSEKARCKTMRTTGSHLCKNVNTRVYLSMHKILLKVPQK